MAKLLRLSSPIFYWTVSGKLVDLRSWMLNYHLLNSPQDWMGNNVFGWSVRRVWRCPGSPLGNKGSEAFTPWCPAAGPLLVGQAEKNNPQRKPARRDTFRLERLTIWLGTSPMGQKCVLEVNSAFSHFTRPSPTQTSIKHLLSLSTWRRQGREKELRGCCFWGESINFSNLSANIKACVDSFFSAVSPPFYCLSKGSMLPRLP